MDLSLKREDCALVILCGGRGERMGGVIKPLLQFPSGKTALQTVAEELSPFAARTYYFATEATREAITRAAGACSIDPGRGPALALVRAASQVEAPWILLAGGDQARVRSEAVARLVSLVTPACSAVIALLDGVRQPMPGLYRTAALRALGEGFGGAALQQVLRALEVVTADAELWPPELRASFSSVNTWEEASALALSLRPLTAE